MFQRWIADRLYAVANVLCIAAERITSDEVWQSRQWKTWDAQRNVSPPQECFTCLAIGALCPYHGDMTTVPNGPIN